MADGSGKPSDMPYITPEVIGQYLRARGATLKCELCFNTSFLDMTKYTNALLVKHQKDRDAPFQNDGGIELVCMVCNNCGNTKMLATAIILNWLNRPKSDP